MISSSVILHPTAKIGPFCNIHADVQIGKGTIIETNVTIHDGVRIGEGCHIHSGSVIGADSVISCAKGCTQTIIGDNTKIFQYVNIGRGTQIGNNCFIMAYCDISCGCVLHNNIVMANMTRLCDGVVVEDWGKFGGGSTIKPNLKIGTLALIQGVGVINKDVPPYILAARNPSKYCGLNAIGLQRRAFTQEQKHLIKEAYHLIYDFDSNIELAIQQLVDTLPMTIEIQHIVDFLKNSICIIDK